MICRYKVDISGVIETLLAVCSVLLLLTTRSLYREKAAPEMEGMAPIGEDLASYVSRMLRHGVAFKSISRSIGIGDPRRLKRILTRKLGYEFQQFTSLTLDEVREQIEEAYLYTNKVLTGGYVT